MTYRKPYHDDYLLRIIMEPFSIHITHKPTNIEMDCGLYRKQLKNKDEAIEQLHLDIGMMIDFS